ncbi:MAG TPA: Ig-like domain-containing protein, partial [Prolixibacteraceae bacterium]|nr:Ig-like domain-containing protein [Prolixibacteraceae bacterium]
RIPANIPFDIEAWDEDGTITKVELFQGEILLGADNEPPYEVEWYDVEAGSYTLQARATDNDNNVIYSEEIKIIVYGGPDGFEFSATENDECVTNKLVNIAFGAEGKFNYIYNVTGTIDCSIEVFGDPAPDVPKACYIQEAPTPYVEIAYPASGKEFEAPAKIAIYAKAVDNDGTIDSVAFYSNDELIGISKVDVNAVASFTWKDVPAGDYSIVAKATDDDENTCFSEPITLKVTGGSAVVDQKTGSLIIYPNPVKKEFVLYIDDCPAKATIQLHDINGKLCIEQKSTGAKNQLNLRGIKSGVYFVTIDSDTHKQVRKIIIN